MILRDKLVFSVPLQRLYERVYFDNVILENCFKPYDAFNDGSIGLKQFVKVITKEVSSIGETEAT